MELELAQLLRGRRTAILTGAGCSTESGIPDYRGPGTRERARRPMQGREFAASERNRQRYWARAAIGWKRFDGVRPNAAHHAIAELEAGGHLTGLVTQNVDGLHGAAGSRNLVELHGALAEVRCLECGVRESRARVQSRILELNPGFDRFRAAIAPDGDADLPAEAVADFRVPVCELCGGILKPDVVFFGESVAKSRVDAAYAIVDAADVLLVVGSSLAVFSGYRFVLRAAERKMPIAIVNVGESRGDAHAIVRVQKKAGEVLPRLALSLAPSELGNRRPSSAT
jgi:NAD-dependent SIR2 family protein deacetylase